MKNPNRYHSKTCETCQVEFLGGGTAKYCPTCRVERIKARERRRTKTVREKERKIGSTSFCKNCKNTYSVKSGNQKYCESCKKEMAKKYAKGSLQRLKNDPARYKAALERSKKWNLDNKERVAKTSHRHYLENREDLLARRKERYLKSITKAP